MGFMSAVRVWLRDRRWIARCDTEEHDAVC